MLGDDAEEAKIAGGEVVDQGCLISIRPNLDRDEALYVEEGHFLLTSPRHSFLHRAAICERQRRQVLLLFQESHFVCALWLFGIPQLHIESLSRLGFLAKVTLFIFYFG